MGDMNEICEDYYNNTLPYLPVDSGDEHRPIFLALAIIYYIYGMAGFIAFVWTKNWVVYSKQKSITSAAIYLIGFYCGITSNLLREGIGRNKFSCQLLAWTHHLPIICLVSQPIGLMYFYIYKLRMERMKTSAIKLFFNDDADTRSSFVYDPLTNSLLTKKSRRMSSKGALFHIIDFFHVMRHSKDGKIIVIDDDISVASEKYETNAPKDRQSTLELVANTSRLQHSTSDGDDQSIKENTWKQSIIEQVGIPIMMMTLFGFPYPIAIALRIHYDPIYAAGCVGCFLTYVDHFMKLACGGLYYPLVLTGIYAMRNEPDPLRVFAELRVAVMFAGIVSLTWIPSTVYSYQGINDRVIINVIEVSGVAGAYFCFVISGIVVAYMEKRKARAAPKRKRRGVGSLSSQRESVYSSKNPPPPSALDLNLILLEPKARSALLEHSINEISSENVVFVFKVRAWKSVWEKEKADKVTKIADTLFKEYVSKDSKAPVNISHGIYNRLDKELHDFLENRSKTDTTKPRKEIFNECELECVRMIEHDLFPRFCRSQLFNREILETGIVEKIVKGQ